MRISVFIERLIFFNNVQQLIAQFETWKNTYCGKFYIENDIATEIAQCSILKHSSQDTTDGEISEKLKSCVLLEKQKQYADQLDIAMRSFLIPEVSRVQMIYQNYTEACQRTLDHQRGSLDPDSGFMGIKLNLERLSCELFEQVPNRQQACEKFLEAKKNLELALKEYDRIPSLKTTPNCGAYSSLEIGQFKNQIKQHSNNTHEIDVITNGDQQIESS